MAHIAEYWIFRSNDSHRWVLLNAHPNRSRISTTWWFIHDFSKVVSGDTKCFLSHHMRDFHFVHKSLSVSVPKVHFGILIRFFVGFNSTLENGLLFELVYANILGKRPSLCGSDYEIVYPTYVSNCISRPFSSDSNVFYVKCPHEKSYRAAWRCVSWTRTTNRKITVINISVSRVYILTMEYPTCVILSDRRNTFLSLRLACRRTLVG